MFVLVWPLVLMITISLYVLILAFLPFDQTWATIFLFALIGFWSRLPGVSMPSPAYFLYVLDFIDIFSIIIAINIGGFPAAVFSFVLNMGSRACGVFPNWVAVTKDSVSQFFVTLMIPWVHVSLGSDIFLTIIWYSILRALGLVILRFVPPQLNSFPQFVINIVTGGFSLFVVNIMYAKLFGDWLDHLLQAGVEFSWLLFLIATVLILCFKLYLVGHSKNKKSFTKKVLKKGLKVVSGTAKKEKQEKPIISQESHEDPFRKV